MRIIPPECGRPKTGASQVRCRAATLFGWLFAGTISTFACAMPPGTFNSNADPLGGTPENPTGSDSASLDHGHASGKPWGGGPGPFWGGSGSSSSSSGSNGNSNSGGSYGSSNSGGSYGSSNSGGSNGSSNSGGGSSSGSNSGSGSSSSSSSGSGSSSGGYTGSGGGYGAAGDNCSGGQDALNWLVSNNSASTSGSPTCTGAAHIDSNGDGWGWENGQSCKVGGGGQSSSSVSNSPPGMRPAVLTFRQENDNKWLSLAATCSGGRTQTAGMSDVALHCDNKSQNQMGYRRVGASYGLTTNTMYCNSGQQLCATFYITKGGGSVVGQVANVHIRDSFTCAQNLGDANHGRFDVDGCTYQELLGIMAEDIKPNSATKMGQELYWENNVNLPNGVNVNGDTLKTSAISNGQYQVQFTIAGCDTGAN